MSPLEQRRLSVLHSLRIARDEMLNYKEDLVACEDFTYAMQMRQACTQLLVTIKTVEEQANCRDEHHETRSITLRKEKP